MSAQTSLRTYKKTIPAGGQIEIQVAGNMFNVLKSESRFTLEFDESNKLEEVPEGATARFSQPYELVRFRSKLEQTVVVVLGFGDFTTSSSVAVATVNASIEVPNSYAVNGLTVTGTQTVELQSESETNRQLIISLPSDSSCGLLIHNVLNSLASGFLLEAGQQLSVASTEQLFAKSENGDAVTINRIATRLI